MDHGDLTSEDWDLIKDQQILNAKIIAAWRDNVGGIHMELLYESPRVKRLKMGDWSFGCAGHHMGTGAEDCPKGFHHHHDEFCAKPNILELKAAGIDPAKYRMRSRA
jgi:hypothetical protein